MSLDDPVPRRIPPVAVSRRGAAPEPARAGGYRPLLAAVGITAAAFLSVHFGWTPRQPGVTPRAPAARPLIVMEAARACRAPNHAVVPRSAVLYVNGAPSVFVAESEARVVMRHVSIAQPAGPDAQVVAGLTAGELVVTSGAEVLRDELGR